MFEVGDWVVRTESVEGDWSNTCVERGVDPYAPIQVSAVSLYGSPIFFVLSKRGGWVQGYFTKAEAVLNKPLEDYL